MSKAQAFHTTKNMEAAALEAARAYSGWQDTVAARIAARPRMLATKEEATVAQMAYAASKEAEKKWKSSKTALTTLAIQQNPFATIKDCGDNHAAWLEQKRETETRIANGLNELLGDIATQHQLHKPADGIFIECGQTQGISI